MIVAVALFELHIPHAQSLKDKRMVVRSIRDRLRHHFDLSVKEVALQDLHQRARLAVSAVALDDGAADAILGKIRDAVEENGEAVVAGWMNEKLDFDELVALT